MHAVTVRRRDICVQAKKIPTPSLVAGIERPCKA